MVSVAPCSIPDWSIPVAIVNGLENGYCSHRCLTVVLFERRRFKRYVTGHAFEFRRSDKPLGGTTE